MKVLVSDPLHEDGVAAIRKLAEVDVVTGLSREELIERISEYDVLVVRGATKVTKDVIEAGKNLKLVVRAGVGIDNIDVKAAEEKGVKVANTPKAPSTAVSELTIGLMLSFARNIPRADASMKRGDWDKKALKGTELSGKTLGIIGTGHIGQDVGTRAKALEMNILLHDILEREDYAKNIGAKYVDIETLLRESDYVSLHLPLTDKTRNMISKKEFGMMKPTAVLVNAARGGVVDEKALVEALKKGEIAGACLDVFEQEPYGKGPLAELPNVVLTPHIGAQSKEAQRAAALMVAERIKEEMSN